MKNLPSKKLLVVALFALVGGLLIWQTNANPNLPGDVNNDNVVNITDLSILLSNWGKRYSGNPNPNPPNPNPNPGGPSCDSGSNGLSAASSSSDNTVVTAASASSFSNAIASAKGGETIVLAAGYKGDLAITGKHFDDAPVTVVAADNSVEVDSVSLTDVRGVAFEGIKYGPSNESTLLKLANVKDVKVLRNTFDHKDVAVNQSSIVITGASSNITIACNEFRDKNKSGSGGTKITGSFIKFQYDGGDAIAKNVHIYKNYFKNIAPYIPAGQTVPAGDSDREAIAMGIADAQNVVTNNIVEYNLFEDTDGENEIITVKTSKNTFRNNTFKNSMGSLSIRFGADTVVENNYFYGTGTGSSPSDPNYQTGGIRTYGTRHILRNNFMRDLTGESWRLPILVDSGDTSNSTGGDGHQTSTNLQVTGNTILNSTGGIHIGSNNYGNKPSGNNVTNNTVSSSKGILFNDVGTGGTWSGNKAYATGGATAVGGATKTSAQVQILTSAPSITEPSPLTPSNVGPKAP